MKNIWKQPPLAGRTSLTSDAIKILLHSKTYKRTYNFLKESQRWSQDQLEEYQLYQLAQLIRHAYQNVPYYTKLFDQLGLKPHNIQDFTDLQKLPFLTKTIVKKNMKYFLAKNYPINKLEYITTGGSTGTPLGLCVEKGIAEAKYLAYIQTLLDHAHCHHSNKNVCLIGNDLPYKYQLFRRILILSSFHMNDETLPDYVNKIRNLKPRYITGYPSAITRLANYMKQHKMKSFPTLKTILCSGETIYNWQQELLEEFFQCRVYSFYNQAEHVIFAGTCPKSNYYHLYPQYGFTEIIANNGDQVTRDGKIGEIVSTGFCNYVFPFIRYKTEDIGVFTTQQCGCGSSYSLLKRIEGRRQECIVTKTERVLPLTGVFGLVARSSRNVEDCQFVQEEIGKIELLIVKGVGYSIRDEQKIRQSFQKKLGQEIHLTITYVDQISHAASGKHRFLIQKLRI